MASIQREIRIDAHPDNVWAAVRDFGAVDQCGGFDIRFSLAASP
jgi:carbon monoxide dehydrogenase subunit G